MQRIEGGGRAPGHMVHREGSPGQAGCHRGPPEHVQRRRGLPGNVLLQQNQLPHSRAVMICQKIRILIIISLIKYYFL